MKLHHLALAAAFATASSFTAAHAASDGSSSTPTCKSGWVYSSSLKRCVKQSSQIVPDNSLKAQGWALARAGRYQDAADLFRLVADKRDPEVLNGLGFTHRKMGLVEQGIAFYQKALKINPDYSAALIQLADTYDRTGDFDQTAKIMERAALRNPRDPILNAQYAAALWRVDRKDEAIDRIEQVVLTEPEYGSAWLMLRDWSQEVGKPELPRKRAEELTRQRPGRAMSWLVLARVLTEFDELDDVLKALDKAVTINPRRVDVHAALVCRSRA